MTTEYEFKTITTADTLPIRQRVLKPHLRAEECVNPGDDLPTTFHFGLFISGNLVSVATFIQESHPAFSAGYPYRLRGMATDDSYRGQGLGQKLVRFGVEELKSRRCDLVWFNARIKAFPFYERLGFSFYGPLFDIKDIGPHKTMYKHLIPR